MHIDQPRRIGHDNGPFARVPFDGVAAYPEGFGFLDAVERVVERDRHGRDAGRHERGGIERKVRKSKLRGGDAGLRVGANAEAGRQIHRDRAANTAASQSQVRSHKRNVPGGIEVGNGTGQRDGGGSQRVAIGEQNDIEQRAIAVSVVRFRGQETRVIVHAQQGVEAAGVERACRRTIPDGGEARQDGAEEEIAVEVQQLRRRQSGGFPG